MRPQHLLRAVGADCYPAQAVCLDTDYTWAPINGLGSSETAVLRRWVAIGFSGAEGAYGKDVYREGETAQQFWEALRKRMRHGRCTWIFSWRSALVWSLLGLWELVESGAVDLCGRDDRVRGSGSANKGNLSCMRCVLEDPPFVIEFRIRGLHGKAKALDLANYGLQPPAEGEAAVAINNRAAAFVRGMVAALKSHDLGSLKDTAGSQSLHSFKRSGLTHLMQCHNNERALNLEGDSYHGGRCEAFRLGQVAGRAYHLDVSAMYPFCAATSSVPVSLEGCTHLPGHGDNDQLGEGRGLIADVLVETDEPAYPYRDVKMGITLWPVGRFRTILAGPELQDALEKSRVIRWFRASWYRMGPALAKHMRRVLRLRSEFVDSPDLELWSKSLGVCLVGKFGQHERRWVDAQTNYIHEPWHSWWESPRKDTWIRWRSVAGYTQREVVGGWSYDAIPAIASWVTSLARMRLLTLIRLAGWPNVYYSDTDALIVNQSGYLNLLSHSMIRPNEPGYLRLKEETRTLVIHGIKHYTTDSDCRCSGRPAQRASNTNGRQRYWRNRGTKWACRERQLPTAERIACAFESKNNYQHGLPCADGTVTPHQLWEEG